MDRPRRLAAGRARRRRAAGLPRNPNRRGRPNSAVVLRPARRSLRPRPPPGLGLLAEPGQLQQRRALLLPAPGLEARARPPRPRRRPTRDGALLAEPALRLLRRRERAGHDGADCRLLPGPWLLGPR